VGIVAQAAEPDPDADFDRFAAVTIIEDMTISAEETLRA